ncbi:hypothetical protein HN51_25960 [Ectopseudomonas mendocina]|jgi:hypothetical protein|uniref:Uncharacterized protein n=1 Tax=Ectopseudomonas mendocina S5.2 TaxID=1225174 RepID=A0ABM5W378_ECTME|nr:hypothetical protein DW68_023775 [Pseudomonas mendocina S5.2]KER98228.1 hypothetical protein HN51_25960 [Pseudomonas mendocina]OEO24331.1 hypothetical protein AX279_16805 [Pseudomonas sp. J237]
MQLLFSLAMFGLAVLALVLPLAEVSNFSPLIRVVLDGVQGAFTLACFLVSAQVACACRRARNETAGIRPVMIMKWVPECA